MPDAKITDTFHVIDETGNRFTVREITTPHEATASDTSSAPPQVHYELEDGRKLSSFLGSRQFRDDASGAFFDRM